MGHTDLPPTTLLLQEIQSVTSSMRRNQRWANHSASSASSSSPLPPAFHPRGRKSVREVSRTGGRAGEEEGDLMAGFVELRRALSGVKDITTLPPLILLSPFLALVRSPLTSGPITALALSSIHNITLAILPLYLAPVEFTITPSTPLQIALAHLTSALSACRFPSSSPQQDELVLLRLLRVIEAVLLPFPFPSPGGSSRSESSKIANVPPTAAPAAAMMDQMADESVCELLEVGLGMLARARLGEGLRSSAQAAVSAVVRGCMARLKGLKKEDVEKLMQGLKEGEGGEVVAVLNVEAVPISQPQEGKEENRSTSQEKEEGSAEEASLVPSEVEQPPSSAKQSVEIVQDHSPPPFTPHGLPTILELLRVLIALLNPADQAHTDSMRLSALAILNTALEVGGSALGRWPELLEGVRDEGCRYLFQLTRSDSPALLASSLRTTSTLFSTLLPHLKLQLELFLSYLIDRLTPSNPTPIPAHLLSTSTISRPGSPAIDSDIDTPTPASSSTPRPASLLPPVPSETRELMLDTLSQIAARESFMVDCWVNFDCSSDSEDMFERLVAFLSRGVYPPGSLKADGSTNFFEGLDNAQLLSLEILLSFLSSMADRLDGEEVEEWPVSAPSPATLTTRKDRKSVLLIGTALFNAKPKAGLAMLEKEGIISPDTSSSFSQGTAEEQRIRGIAKFLRGSSRLDKKELGDWISRPDQVGLLKAFIGSFDFKGKSIADAMRELLETFRLPGEAQPISRITETFAEHFFSFNPPEIASQDAVYVLSYSVIMLNTDLHNPQNRKRMTIDDYKRNLRGVNDGKDFDPDYLAAIHDSLRKKEIILPEEHVGQPGFDYAWKSLMQRSRTAGPMIICNTSIFDEQMFRLSWRPLIASIAYAFTTSSHDEHVIQKAITGFRQCASLAGHFNLPEVFDTIVQSLFPSTGLGPQNEGEEGIYNFPTVSISTSQSLDNVNVQENEKDSQTLTVSPLSIKFGQSYRSQIATVVLFTIANGNGNAIREGWAMIFEMFQTLFLHSLLPTPMLQMEDFLAGTSTIPLRTNTNTNTNATGTGVGAGGGGGGGGGLLSTLSSYLLSPYGSGNGGEGVVGEPSEEDVESTLVAVDCLGSCKLEELYAEVLSLNLEALLPALRALRALAESRTTARLPSPRSSKRPGSASANGDSGSASASNSPQQVQGEWEGQLPLPYDPACVFLLEMMVSLAGRGEGYITETWPIVFEYISSLLSSAQSFSVLLIERAVVGLLRLCLIVSENPALRDQLYIALDVLRSLPSSVLNAVSEQLMAGIARILEKDSTVVKSQTEWGLIIALFRATVAHPEASKVTLGIVQRMTAISTKEQSTSHGGPGVSGDNYGGVVALLDEFATAAGAATLGRPPQKRASQPTMGPTVEKGLAALDSLYELRNVVPALMKESDLSVADAWMTFYLPPLLVLAKHCINPTPPIRQRAITYLQRLLLSIPLSQPTNTTSDTAAAAFDPTIPIFDKVLFPILDELLKSPDPSLSETRLRAAALLCKVFLADIGRLEGIVALFGRVLGVMERMVRAERDGMNEAGESLKNVVLVLHSSNLLVPPPPQSAPAPAPAEGEGASAASDDRTPLQKELWEKSVGRIARILPGFLEEAIQR